MNIEQALAENTAALIANTAAHAKLADVAMAATSGKSVAQTKTESADTGADDEVKETAAEKKKRLAAEKKTAAAKAKAETKLPEVPELVAEMPAAELHVIAAAFMADELDEESRDANKANFVGGLAHLGAKKFSALTDDSERARLAAYIGLWSAGLDVDFEAVDEQIAALSEGDDDPMG